MRIKRIHRLLPFVFATTCLVLQPLPTLAQDVSTPSSASQQPTMEFIAMEQGQSGFLNFEIEPGESESVTLLIGNSGNTEFEAVTYTADAYSIRNGGFGVRELQDDRTGSTLWLDFPDLATTLGPGESVQRELTVSVPLDTPPGEYVTAVVMQSSDPTTDESPDVVARLDLVTRSAIGVRILVPGELHASIQIGEPKFHNDQITYAVIVPIINTGNTQTSPSGELSVMDSDGQLVFTAPIEMGRVYGGHETELRIGLRQPLPEGEYQVSLVLDDEIQGVHAELPPTVMLVSSANSQVGEDVSPVAFTQSSAEPMPAADNVQFLTVDATITNTTEEPVANAQLSLIAKVDGEEVERFPISQSLSLPPGDTDVSTRYIPLTGWTSGEWEFELLLETVEGSGTAVVVDSVPIELKVTIP